MSRLHTSNTAKRVTLVVTLLGVIGAVAGFALANGGPPAPRITSHPALRTRARTATFFFDDSEHEVTFVCSLDGARYKRCTSPQHYGVQAPGRHTFRVRAKSPSGGVGDWTSYAWTINIRAPRLAVSFPARKGAYGAAWWRIGCRRFGTGLCGTVVAPSGAKAVIVWIKQDATGRWWNGHAFSSRKAVWKNAILLPKPGKGKRLIRVEWMYKLSLPRRDGTYTLLARARDQTGNLNRLRTQKRVSFRIDTDPPAPPRIASGPADTTSATSATLTFSDASAEVTYRCDLDSAGWRPCNSPITYSSLAPGLHVFQVRAVDDAGNLSAAATYPWTVTDPGLPFTITGSATGALYPGAAGEPIAVTISNPNAVPIYVTSVTVTLNTSSLPAGCSASGYEINQASIPAAGVIVAANGSISLPAQGASAPSVQMLDTGTNQDSCQNAQLGLDYTGSAHS
jgi:hypothetical protein